MCVCMCVYVCGGVCVYVCLWGGVCEHGGVSVCLCGGMCVHDTVSSSTRLLGTSNQGCFCTLAIVKNAAVNMCEHVSPQDLTSVLDIYAGVGWLDHMVIQFSFFEEAA